MKLINTRRLEEEMKIFPKSKLLVLMATTLLLCSGCSKEEKETVNSVTNAKEAYNKAMSKDAIGDEGIVNDAVVLIVDDMEVTYSEALVYILMIKQEYGDLFGEDVWSLNVSDEETFEDLAKKEIINQITRLKVIESGAIKEGISIEADEEIEIENQAMEYLGQIRIEDQEKYGITLDIANKVVYNNFLAQKSFDAVTMDVDTTVEEGAADPSEAGERSKVPESPVHYLYRAGAGSHFRAHRR